MNSNFTIADGAPKLPRTPWRFAMHFYKKAKLAILAIFIFEAGEATCMIMLPYAIKQIIDAVNLANKTGADIFDASYDALVLFALLNVGFVLFSRASGSMLVIAAPPLRAKIKKTLFNYLQYHSHRYFTSNFAGSLANRISEVAVSCMHALWGIIFDFYIVFWFIR